MAEFRAGQILYAADMNAVFGDSGVLTIGITPATGWTVLINECRVIGKFLDLRLEIENTSAATVTGSPAGNITPDRLVATITEVAKRPLMNRYLIYRANVTSGSCDISATTGEINLRDIHPGATVPVTNSVQISDIYTIP